MTYTHLINYDELDIQLVHYTKPERWTELYSIVVNGQHIGAYYVDTQEIWIEDSLIRVNPLRQPLKDLIRQRFGVSNVSIKQLD